MKRLVFDIETLPFPNPDHTWLITICDADTDERVYAYHDNKELERDGSIEDGLHYLEGAEVLIGHNVLCFDFPALQRNNNWTRPPGTDVVDTLVASRLCFSDLRQQDYSRWPKGHKDARYCGSHALGAWGRRLGNHKGEYTGDFKQLDQELLTYGIQDTALNRDLFKYLEPLLPEFEADGMTTLQLEQWFMLQCEDLQKRGVRFNVEKAHALVARLRPRKLELEDGLAAAFPPTKEKYAVNKKTGKQTMRRNDAGEMVDHKLVPFKFNSRLQLARRLQAKYGWVPAKFTDDRETRPSMVEEVMLQLGELYPEAKLAAELYIVNARIGILEAGKGSYLNYVDDDGRIHGKTLHIGTVSHRCSHSSPNLGNPTSVKKPWGKEIRELFEPEPGMILVGGDGSGLEQRMLAHYLGAFDDGAYAETVESGDIHTQYQLILKGIKVNASRDDTKTIEYAELYGAGDDHLGKLCGGDGWLGKKVKTAFAKGIKGKEKLLALIDHFRRKEKGLKSLDGRWVPIRYKHAQLNSALQAAGAVVMKWQLYFLYLECEKRGIRWLVDYIPHLLVHDEVQGSLKPELLPLFEEAFAASFTRVEEIFSMRIPLRCDVKSGSNWYETH